MDYNKEIAKLKKELSNQKKINKQNEIFFNETIQATAVIKKTGTKNKTYSLIKCNKAFLEITKSELPLPVDIISAPLSFDSTFKKEIEDFFNNTKSEYTHFRFVHNAIPYLCGLKKATETTALITIDSSNKNKTLFNPEATKVEQESNDQIRIKEDLFKSVFEDAPIAIILVNQNIQPILCNAQFSRMTGFSYEEILNMSLKDFTHPEDYETNAKLYKQLFNNEITNFTLTKRYIKKDQSYIWVKVTVSEASKGNNKTKSAIVMVQDISAEKKATSELIKSEYKYRTLIENANDGIGLFDENFKPILYNTSLYEALGFDINTYLKIDHSKYELFHPEDVKDAEKSFKEVKKGIRSRIEKRLRHKDGSYHYFSISYIPVIHEDKPAALIFRRDISKRKEAEAQNEEYKLFLETLMDNLPVSLFAKTTPDFRYLYWNKTIEKVTGIQADDAIGCSDYELNQFKKEAKKYNDEDKKLLRNQQRIENEYSFTNALGENKKFRSIKTIHTPSIGNPIILGISMDVTQLREAEDMIEQSNHIIKEAQKIAKLGYWEYDVQKDLVFDNIENRQIIGTQKLSYFLNFEQFLALIHPSDKENLLLSFNNCIKNKEEGEGIIKVQVKNSIKHLSINYKPIFDDNGEVSKVRGTTIDITRIRSSEIALKESEYKLKQAEHIAKVGYWNYDYEKNETQFSDEIWNLLDLKSQNKPINFMDFFGNIHPDDKADVNITYLKQKNHNKPFDFDFRIITTQNKIKHIKAKGAFVINKHKKPVRSIGIFQDITLLKEKEIALNHSAMHLAEVQKLSKTGYIEVQYDEDKTIFSDTIWDILDIPKGSISNHSEFNQFIVSEERQLISDKIDKTLKAGSSHNIQYRIKLKSGAIKYLNEICIIGEHKTPTHKYATRVVQDITTIKQQDIALKHSISDIDKLKKTNDLGSWEYNTVNKTFILSEELQKLINLDSKDKPIPFNDIIDLIHPDDQFSIKKILTDSLRKKQNYTLTYRIYNTDFTILKHIKDNGSFMKNSKGEWTLKSIIKDVTEIKNKEIKLLESNDLVDTFIENKLFATFIYRQNKLVFNNKKWCSLIGLDSKNKVTNIKITDVLDQISVEKLMSLFSNWDSFKINEYTNTLRINPLKSKPFNAEIFVKEILLDGKKSFLVMAYVLNNE